MSRGFQDAILFIIGVMVISAMIGAGIMSDINRNEKKYVTECEAMCAESIRRAEKIMGR